MSKNGGRTPTGVHSVQNRSCRRGISVASGGRPESETDTPANIGNGPYRDNGEGVAATPLPYPLESPGEEVSLVGAPPRRVHSCPFVFVRGFHKVASSTPQSTVESSCILCPLMSKDG